MPIRVLTQLRLPVRPEVATDVVRLEDISEVFHMTNNTADWARLNTRIVALMTRPWASTVRLRIVGEMNLGPGPGWPATVFRPAGNRFIQVIDPGSGPTLILDFADADMATLVASGNTLVASGITFIHIANSARVKIENLRGSISVDHNNTQGIDPATPAYYINAEGWGQCWITDCWLSIGHGGETRPDPAPFGWPNVVCVRNTSSSDIGMTIIKSRLNSWSSVPDFHATGQPVAVSNESATGSLPTMTIADSIISQGANNSITCIINQGHLSVSNCEFNTGGSNVTTVLYNQGARATATVSSSLLGCGGNNINVFDNEGTCAVSGLQLLWGLGSGGGHFIRNHPGATFSLEGGHFWGLTGLNSFVEQLGGRVHLANCRISSEDRDSGWDNPSMNSSGSQHLIFVQGGENSALTMTGCTIRYSSNNVGIQLNNLTTATMTGCKVFQTSGGTFLNNFSGKFYASACDFDYNGGENFLQSQFAGKGAQAPYAQFSGCNIRYNGGGEMLGNGGGMLLVSGCTLNYASGGLHTVANLNNGHTELSSCRMLYSGGRGFVENLGFMSMTGCSGTHSGGGPMVSVDGGTFFAMSGCQFDFSGFGPAAIELFGQSMAITNTQITSGWNSTGDGILHLHWGDLAVSGCHFRTGGSRGPIHCTGGTLKLSDSTLITGPMNSGQAALELQDCESFIINCQIISDDGVEVPPVRLLGNRTTSFVNTFMSLGNAQPRDVCIDVDGWTGYCKLTGCRLIRRPGHNGPLLSTVFGKGGGRLNITNTEMWSGDNWGETMVLQGGSYYITGNTFNSSSITYNFTQIQDWGAGDGNVYMPPNANQWNRSIAFIAPLDAEASHTSVSGETVTNPEVGRYQVDTAPKPAARPDWAVAYRDTQTAPVRPERKAWEPAPWTPDQPAWQPPAEGYFTPKPPRTGPWWNPEDFPPFPPQPPSQPEPPPTESQD